MVVHMSNYTHYTAGSHVIFIADDDRPEPNGEYEGYIHKCLKKGELYMVDIKANENGVRFAHYVHPRNLRPKR
ncbi:hypothetical protein FDI54_gp110 [Mycobacterium phage Pumpkin]|uniref:Uncharacterized protein n=1 Tax=Mycobacterium phage Pumpkin TaxID=2919547 RepID=C9DCV7_9CAUD|nr:hypothetical protein FDI54_gp110 [Mycobacterium phage Pumpkin]ACU42075.1 hypothetical protein PUMPKIN_143 [Mycobacterium phage Pumpkin]